MQAFEVAREVVDLRRCKAPRRSDLRVDEAYHLRIERGIRPVGQRIGAAAGVAVNIQRPDGERIRTPATTVPLIKPLEAFSASPGGNAPADTE